MRTIIVHEHANIDYEIVWNVVTSDHSRAFTRGRRSARH
jgi:uncharacterized protein with HEPN domain